MNPFIEFEVLALLHGLACVLIRVSLWTQRLAEQGYRKMKSETHHASTGQGTSTFANTKESRRYTRINLEDVGSQASGHNPLLYRLSGVCIGLKQAEHVRAHTHAHTRTHARTCTPHSWVTHTSEVNFPSRHLLDATAALN